MQQIFLQILTALFGVSSIVSFVAYFPTIRDLWNRKPSANTASYYLWGCTTLTASLYGHFVLLDPFFILFADLQFLACSIIIVLRLRLPR